MSDPASATHWIALFNWAGTVLQPPKRGGKRHNLTATIKSRISSFAATAPLNATVDPRHDKRRRVLRDSQLSQAVAAKLEDGNVRAAVRLLMSEDSPAEPCSDSLAKLQEKHPQATVKADDLPPSSPVQSLSVDESQVRLAVLSFPAGSAGGPDGLRPQHIRDLLLCREAGSDFLTALTAFVNLVLAGRCPLDVAPIFFGGRLLALNKKSGGIRPIAIGFTLRRLASKCANSFGISQLKASFYPHQLGVGIPGGCEAAIHSGRRYLEAMPDDHVLVKLDFSNAFNSLHRHDMLLAVLNRVPELYPYCCSAYSHPSTLFFGPHTISSEEGPQQGDPLGPLLFCNTIQPLLSSLASELNLGYLDDVTLGGPADTVASDVAEIAKVGGNMGLILNSSKCELLAHPGVTVNDKRLQSFQRVLPSDATLLGAPLFHGPVLDQAWADRCDDLSVAINRLSQLGSHDALLLLRSSFSAPKVLHLLRCSPSVAHSSLVRFDSLLRSAIQGITNSDLSDIQWLQASLPVKDGGLGVRRVSSLTFPAFLASAVSILFLQEDIPCMCSDHATLQTYLSEWLSQHSALPDILPAKQPFWDQPGVLADKAVVKSSLSSPCQSASFLSASSLRSGDWLFSLLIASCSLRLDDEVARTAVTLRLGLLLCVPHPGRCGSLVSTHFLHSFVCK